MQHSCQNHFVTSWLPTVAISITVCGTLIRKTSCTMLPRKMACLKSRAGGQQDWWLMHDLFVLSFVLLLTASVGLYQAVGPQGKSVGALTDVIPTCVPRMTERRAHTSSVVQPVGPLILIWSLQVCNQDHFCLSLETTATTMLNTIIFNWPSVKSKLLH